MQKWEYLWVWRLSRDLYSIWPAEKVEYSWLKSRFPQDNINRGKPDYENCYLIDIVEKWEETGEAKWWTLIEALGAEGWEAFAIEEEKRVIWFKRPLDVPAFERP